MKTLTLSNEQLVLLEECVRYRKADNQRERQEAIEHGVSAKWYDEMEKRLEGLKQLIYDIN